MFHRPKNDEKNTAVAAGLTPPKKAEDMPAGPFGGLRVNIPLSGDKVDPAKTIAQPRFAAKPDAQPMPPAPAAAPLAAKTELAKTDSAKTAPANTETPRPEEKIMAVNKEDSNDKQPSRPLDIPGSSSSYQPQPARVQSPVFASPSYSPNPATPPVAVQKAPGRRLVIGQGISLSGEIEACEFLVIEGTVEAALKGASVLEIAETGVFYGTVEIDEATVAGRFEGDITCNGRLTITATGSVTGSIAYKELSIEAGATLDGKVNPLGGSKVGAKKPERQAKKAAPRNDNAGDNGVELPLTGTASA